MRALYLSLKRTTRKKTHWFISRWRWTRRGHWVLDTLPLLSPPDASPSRIASLMALTSSPLDWDSHTAPRRWILGVDGPQLWIFERGDFIRWKPYRRHATYVLVLMCIRVICLLKQLDDRLWANNGRFLLPASRQNSGMGRRTCDFVSLQKFMKCASVMIMAK